MRASQKFNQTKQHTTLSRNKNQISNLQLGLSQSFILPTRNGRNTKSTFHGSGIPSIPSISSLVPCTWVKHMYYNQNKANSVLPHFPSGKPRTVLVYTLIHTYVGRAEYCKIVFELTLGQNFNLVQPVFGSVFWFWCSRLEAFNNQTRTNNNKNVENIANINGKTIFINLELLPGATKSKQTAATDSDSDSNSVRSVSIEATNLHMKDKYKLFKLQAKPTVRCATK